MTLAVSAVCFPPDDVAFSGAFSRLVEVHPGQEFLAAVEALLRESYPLARISARHELAALDGRRVWYCFRDGTARSTPASGSDQQSTDEAPMRVVTPMAWVSPPTARRRTMRQTIMRVCLRPAVQPRGVLRAPPPRLRMVPPTMSRDLAWWGAVGLSDRLILHPASDRTFRRSVDDSLQRSGLSAQDPAIEATVHALLRTLYPMAHIQLRTGEPGRPEASMWDVFRDDDSLDRSWPDGPATAMERRPASSTIATGPSPWRSHSLPQATGMRPPPRSSPGTGPSSTIPRPPPRYASGSPARRGRQPCPPYLGTGQVRSGHPASRACSARSSSWPSSTGCRAPRSRSCSAWISGMSGGWPRRA